MVFNRYVIVKFVKAGEMAARFGANSRVWPREVSGLAIRVQLAV